MKKSVLLRASMAVAVFCCGVALYAQSLPETTVNWSSAVEENAAGQQQIVLRGTPVVPLDQVHGTVEWVSCVGEACHSPEEAEFQLSLGAAANGTDAEPVRGSAPHPSQAAAWAPPAHDAAGGTPLGVSTDGSQPTDNTISVSASSGHEGKGAGGLWALILEAVLWGLAMLLTPCVFPMVPMTVSFFIKGEGKAGRFKALMYGLFIVLLYTVPISLIIGLTWLFGGSAVTADIFNWLATHWLPNIIFFIVFMIFAASFFGAFEIVMPSKLVNASDKNSYRGGLGGVFFMALTLVLVSFSCTGPIVGTVLIKSTSGEFWAPMITMLAFSIAFALPFTLLAFFPSVLKSLPKSGGWLNSVKVVLGFIELALGLKFLSVADQTYHWGILDREVYLAIWIVVFTLLGFYLLGKIRFKYDDKLEHVGLTRLALAIAVFSFVVYMIPGMFGAPLKALSGYLPPMETQDFVLGGGGRIGGDPVTAQPSSLPSGTWAPPAHDAAGGTPLAANGPAAERLYSGHTASEGTAPPLALPHGLRGYGSLEDGLAAAKRSGKRVFVDISGHGCVNCREMEARVWSDPEVLQRLANDFEIVALYTDDKIKLPREQWITTPEGKTLKDVGRVNSYIARSRFGVNAQPNYIILDASGSILAGPRGYNLSIPDYIAFLDASK